MSIIKENERFKEALDDFQKNVMPQVSPNYRRVYNTVLSTVVAAYEKNKKTAEQLLDDK